MAVEHEARGHGGHPCVSFRSEHERFQPPRIRASVLVEQGDIIGPRLDRQTNSNVVALTESQVPTVFMQQHLGEFSTHEVLAAVCRSVVDDDHVWRPVLLPERG